MYNVKDFPAISYTGLEVALSSNKLAVWRKILPEQIQAGLSVKRWGDLPAMYKALTQLPEITPSSIDFNSQAVRIGLACDTNEVDQQQLINVLQTLHPWRKGPFEYFGITVDTEWQSWMKWNRIKDQLCLKDHQVLDIGCGNSYYAWRMLGAGARYVIGVDPSPRFVLQWSTIKYYLDKLGSTHNQAFVLPLGIEQIPGKLKAFDSTFSMGILYHRRSPIDHLLQLKETLKPQGQLILETLIVDGAEGYSLVPDSRYAKMNNVWFLPSILTLQQWLKRCKFGDIRVIDISPTTTEEQRKTAWMTFESLSDFLNEKDPRQTIEGYPAPKRVVIIANT